MGAKLKFQKIHETTFHNKPEDFKFLAVFFCDDDDLAGTKSDPQKSRDPIRFDPYGEFRRRNDNLESDVVSNLK